MIWVYVHSLFKSEYMLILLNYIYPNFRILSSEFAIYFKLKKYYQVFSAQLYLQPFTLTVESNFDKWIALLPVCKGGIGQNQNMVLPVGAFSLSRDWPTRGRLSVAMIHPHYLRQCLYLCHLCLYTVNETSLWLSYKSGRAPRSD